MDGCKYIKRNCPICDSNKQSIKKINSFIKAQELDLNELIPYWNGFFKQKIFFSYVRCNVCKVQYAPIFFSSQQLELLYKQMSPNMDIVPLAALIRTQIGYFNKVRKYSNLENGYLELGPDIGLFTTNCVKKGAFDKYWLFEPNLNVKNKLEYVMGNSDFTIINDMNRFTQVKNNTIGLAVLIHVLDHILDPVKTLIELREKLSPEGHILLVTHNEKSILRKIVGNRWPAYCLQHPQLYSPTSMEYLLKKSGYKVLTIEKTINYFEISFLIKNLFWCFGIKIKKLPRIFDITIGLRLGNIITIAIKN